MALPTITDTSLQKTNELTTQFSGLATNVSQSCDLMGTISSIKDKVTQYVVDEVTGAVTEVKVAVSEVVSDIKAKLSSMFAGSGSVLNTIKGYIQQGQALAAEIAAKASQISAAVMAQLQSLMDTINSGIQYATDAVKSAISTVVAAMGVVRDKVSDAVAGIKMGMCSTLSSVLAGTPNDAFSNITSGTTDTALTSLGAVKDVYNAGADNILTVTDAVAEKGGMSSVVNSFQAAAGSAANIASGSVGTSMTSTGSAIASMRSILTGIV